MPGGPIYPHLDAARAARVMVVAPCSANTLAKLAHGLADNVLTESALALAGRLVVAPAMNVRMWEHPATQAAVALLAARGAVIVGPEHGELAEGETGAGRLAAPGRHPRRRRPSCCGPPGRSPAAACWSPPAARASRSTRCASSATAPAAAWASPSPTPPCCAAPR